MSCILSAGGAGGVMEGRETTASPSSPTREQPRDPGATFNFAAMHTCKAGFALLNWALDYPQREWLLGLLRRFWPIARVPFMGVFVSRDEDVREVLAHDKEFPVPWADRMMHLSHGKNFVLGMADGPEYRLNYQQLADAFRREDVALYVTPQAAKASEDMLRSKNRIDAVRDLIWSVPSQLCEDYYGIEIPDKPLFAEWTIAMSSYLFGSCRSKKSVSGEPLAMTGADCFRAVISRAIQTARQGRSLGVVLPRLIAMQQADPRLTDDVLVAHLFGMVTGFIPTNVLAGGYILSTLLRNQSIMAQTREAAMGDDDDLLWCCLRETLRFRNINLGPFRICGPNGYTIAAGTRRKKYVAPGRGLLASTQSAMFDPRRIAHPRRFDPQRPAEDYLVFGYGQHWCMGSFIAIAQITQTFKALLRKPGLRRAQGADGRLQTVAVFPAHLWLEFDE
jgi:cytochrome P450